MSFGSETDFHGFNRPAQARNRFERLIWTVILFITCFLMVSRAVTDCKFLLSHPFVTHVSEITNYTFPYVTVCPPWWLDGGRLRKMRVDRRMLLALNSVWPNTLWGYKVDKSRKSGTDFRGLMNVLTRTNSSLDELFSSWAYPASRVVPEARLCFSDEPSDCKSLRAIVLRYHGICYSFSPVELTKEQYKRSYVSLAVRKHPLPFNFTSDNSLVFNFQLKPSLFIANHQFHYRIQLKPTLYRKLYGCVDGFLDVWGCRFEKLVELCRRHGAKPGYVAYTNLHGRDVTNVSDHESCYSVLRRRNASPSDSFAECQPPCDQWSFAVVMFPYRKTNAMDDSIIRIYMVDPSMSLMAVEVNRLGFLPFVGSLANEASLVCGASILSLAHLVQFIFQRLLWSGPRDVGNLGLEIIAGSCRQWRQAVSEFIPSF